MPSPADVVGGMNPTGARINCKACGSSTVAGFQFCQNCGKPIEIPQSDEAVAATLAASPEQADRILDEVDSKQPPPRPVPRSNPTAKTYKGEELPDIVPPPAPAEAAIGTPVPGTFTPPTRADLTGPRERITPSARPSVVPVRKEAPPPPVDDEADDVWGELVSVNRDGTDGKRYKLGGGWRDVGRADSDISFDDKYLALRHARFERREGLPFVVPLDRFNGVFRKISQRFDLTSGDMLLLGRELLRFEFLEPSEVDVAPLVRHGVAMFGSPIRRAWGRLMQMIPNGGMRDVRHLCGAKIVIGREEGDIVFRDDEFLSRRHASLSWDGDKCVLEDLRSSNGTFLRLTRPTPLARGDQLRMGDQMFRFEPATRP